MDKFLKKWGIAIVFLALLLIVSGYALGANASTVKVSVGNIEMEMADGSKVMFAEKMVEMADTLEDQNKRITEVEGSLSTLTDSLEKDRYQRIVSAIEKQAGKIEDFPDDVKQIDIEYCLIHWSDLPPAWKTDYLKKRYDVVKSYPLS